MGRPVTGGSTNDPSSPELDIEDARRLSAVESEGICGGEESMLGRVESAISIVQRQA
jgi:hypothetical protein